jgi:pimeloyl-ACP methyl ester carboxylesterase
VLIAVSSLVIGSFAGPLMAGTPDANEGHSPSWVDPANPELTHRIVDANGIRLHVVEQGTGPLIVLCHGFPECWYSWRHQLTSLARAGFRAVAVYMRGYGRSDRPREADRYTVLDHASDIVGVLDALGAKDAVIAGHDFGATVAWEAALMRPDRFRALISLDVPFRPRGFGTPVRPTSVMPQNGDAMYYQLYLQTPEARKELERDVRRTFRSLFNALSGDRPTSASGGGANGLAGMGMVPRKRGSVLIDSPSLPAWITESEMDFYVAEFTRTGFSGPLNWYRNIDRSWELLGITQGATVNVPVLFMAGDRDFVVSANQQSVAKQAAVVPKLHAITLPGCGHWTQQERASEVNAAMVDFLARI